MLLRKGIPWKYVLEKIKYEIVVVALYSTVIAFWHSELNVNHISIPLAVPSILGTIISLLLAFNSNQAYDRWWEARIIWGSIVNDSRTLVRQLQTFMSGTGFAMEKDDLLERFTRRQIFWVYSLGKHLRKQDPLSGDTDLISEEELRFVARHSNKPNALLSLHGQDIRFALQTGKINDYQQVQLDETLTRLCDAMGKSERIKNTVFPTTYSMYIHMVLYLFIILLPFGMTEYLGFVQVPIVVAIAASMLLIENMAIYLMDPFEGRPTDTPVTTIAQGIDRDLRQMLNNEEELERKVSGIEVQQTEVYYTL